MQKSDIYKSWLSLFSQNLKTSICIYMVWRYRVHIQTNVIGLIASYVYALTSSVICSSLLNFKSPLFGVVMLDQPEV